MLPRIGSKEYLSVGMHGCRFPVPVEESRADFERQHAISIENMLDPGLLALLKNSVGGNYATRLNAGGQVQYQDPPRGSMIMDMILSRTEILRWMEAVSGTKDLRFFGGRFSR